MHQEHTDIVLLSAQQPQFTELKNREFENVVIVWPYGVTGSAEKQRRLLYNAITRAKNNCIVLDLRKASDVKNDKAVLRLLGNANSRYFLPSRKARK